MNNSWHGLLLFLAAVGFCSCKSPMQGLTGNPANGLAPDHASVATLPSSSPAQTGLAAQARPSSPHQHANSQASSHNQVQPRNSHVAYQSPDTTPENAAVAQSVELIGPPQGPLHDHVLPPELPGVHEAWPAHMQWRPPGIPGTWPRDEYLFDGGDHPPGVVVSQDWTVRGLELEDTVAHYDTLDGQRLVEPACRVCIYAPRFAAVRKVQGVAQNDAFEHIDGFRLDEGPRKIEETDLVTTALQQQQPNRQIGSKVVTGFHQRNRSSDVENIRAVSMLVNVFEPYEDFQVIKFGVYSQSEQLRLSQAIAAAQAWDHYTAVQAVVDNVQAVVVRSHMKPQEEVGVEENDRPKLCICKVADKKAALPGDTVEFTLRFDNVGNRKIGNVTLIDNLTTRLEYVEGSAQCSLDADFFTIENQGDSLILRWEIKSPMEPGEGGIARFKCIVR